MKPELHQEAKASHYAVRDAMLNPPKVHHNKRAIQKRRMDRFISKVVLFLIVAYAGIILAVSWLTLKAY